MTTRIRTRRTLDPFDPPKSVHPSLCQGPCAMERVLKIQLILQKILDRLDFLSLQSSRGVSRLWRRLATNIMLTRDCTTVKISKIDLEPIKFPWTNFQFIDCDPFHLEKFLSVHGSKMKFVTFRRTCRGMDAHDEFPQNLLHKIPNVTSLSICGYSFKFSQSDSIFFLPNLKTLLINDCRKCFQIFKIPYQILQMALNLTTIQNFDFLRDLNRLVEADKIKTIKSIQLDDYSYPSQLDLFMMGKPQIENLKFNCYVRAEAEMRGLLTRPIQKLLKMSSSSLKTLEFSGLCRFYQIQFPQFRQLNQLKIVKYGGGPIRIFSKLLNLNQTFPNLRCLDLSELTEGAGEWDKYFPRDAFKGSLESVGTLIVSLATPEGWLGKLEELCPNFKKLVLIGTSSTENQYWVMLDKIFRFWRHLQSIELRIESLQTIINFDSIFAGISVTDCDWLEDSKEAEDDERIEKMDMWSSLCEMSELKTLRIFLGSPSYAKFIKLTRTSAQLTFQHMPDLKVTIFYKHNCPEAGVAEKAFESIAPFVNINDVYFFNCSYDQLSGTRELVSSFEGREN